MTQTPKLRIALFLSLFLFFGIGLSAAIDFKTDDFEAVKEKAGEEGKLFFVNFTAKWCAPCKFMEQYTYTDPILSEYVNENYLALKLDISSFDGITYKKEFDIKTLPAIVVLNSKGEMVGKYEKSMSAGKMQFIMEDHNIPANRVKVIKPKPEVKPEPKKVIPKAIPKKESKPVIPQEREVVLTAKGGTGKYTVQVGAFHIYDNVYNESQRLREQLSQVTTIQPSSHSNDGFNRLFVGKFETLQEANQFGYELQQAGFEAIVRVLP